MAGIATVTMLPSRMVISMAEAITAEGEPAGPGAARGASSTRVHGHRSLLSSSEQMRP